MGCSTQEAEQALTRWAEQHRQTDMERDRLVLGALACGVTKHRVHVLTGVARTTIDRIADKEQHR